jgi:hypothetical protein
MKTQTANEMNLDSVTDYPWIVKWGRMSGSYGYYIAMKVNRARADKAPANATHQNDDGTWATTDDITSRSSRLRLGLEPIVAVPARIEICFNDGTKSGWELPPDVNEVITSLVESAIDRPFDYHIGV